MKLGVFTVLLGQQPLDKALEYLHSLGVEMVEIGCAGFPGTDHCDPKELLADEKKLKEFQDTIARNHMEISALSCHGNPEMCIRDRLLSQSTQRVFPGSYLTSIM